MKSGAGLGTFAGVFTPSLLTILGMVLFLRLGTVVGEVGLDNTFLILGVAHAISILTSLSVAAIATNLRVKGGGDYYLISRTLGLGYGGAIGLVLFVAQSVAAGFYCIGFAEALSGVLGQLGNSFWLSRGFAVSAALVLFCVAWTGAEGAARLQYLIMALLFSALASFGLGAWTGWDPQLLLENRQGPPGSMPFWVAFAVFFPAVTGFTQGISMSGDLRDPGRSIPTGTLLAVSVSMVAYFVAAVLFAGAAPASELSADGLAMKRLSEWPVLFDIGVIAATLSSALASLMGAPRILQAMARDEVLSWLAPLRRGDGPGNNPRRALMLTAAIAGLVILWGKLNAVAGVVSMFFLLSYALLNYATYFEASASSPSFRPSFRFFSRHASLAGALACVGVMLAIDALAAAAAGAVVFAILQYVRLRAVPARWADSRRSYHLQQVRNHLLAAAEAPQHPRDWRPQILVFSGDRERRAWILKLASWIEGGAGISTVVRVLESQGEAALDQRAAALEQLRTELDALGSRAFPLVVAAPKLDHAISVVVQAAGVGPVMANTVIANWLRDSGVDGSFSAARFSRNLRTALRTGCHLLLLDADAPSWSALDALPGRERRIDIWWNRSRTSDLMLLMAYLMTRSRDWDGAQLRLLAVGTRDDPAEARAKEMRERLESLRIEAETCVLADGDTDTLLQSSRDASLVFVPFTLYGAHFYGPRGTEVALLLDQLPVTVLAMAAEDVDLEADPEPKSGEETGPPEPGDAETAAPG